MGKRVVRRRERKGQFINPSIRSCKIRRERRIVVRLWPVMHSEAFWFKIFHWNVETEGLGLMV
jgi:hypothetical protein